MELVRNRSFTLTTSDKQSRLRRLKNNVPQGSVLASLLFNIYTYDLSSMIFRKFAYAHDLVLLHSSGIWKDLNGILSQDMSTLSGYLQTWRLKLSHTNTVTATFHLTEKPNVSYKSTTTIDFYRSVQTLLILGYNGTVRSHFLTIQWHCAKTITAHHTAETTCRLRMGCWCQSTTHSCLISGLLYS